MNQTLAELDDELSLLFTHLDTDKLEDLAVAETLLDELLPQLVEKIDGYMGLISHYDDKVTSIDREIARLQARRYNEVAKQTYLKSYLQQWLELRSEQIGATGRKIEGNLYKVTLATNGGKQPIKINPDIPIDRVPVSFATTTITTKVDPDKIRDYMTANDTDTVIDPDTGETIAALLPRGKHLRIS